MASLRVFISTLLVQNCSRRGISHRTILRRTHSSLLNILSTTLPKSTLSSSFAHTSLNTEMKRFMGMSSAVKSSPEPNEDVEENYQNAIRTLNTLQSNSATLAKVRLNPDERRNLSIPNTIGGILKSGLSLESIDKLDIIHVAGTKGKGMTCAFTESILRQAGLKTGFFSSPHLTAVRERIRINGRPLTEDHFARVFFTVYHKLKHLRKKGNDNALTEEEVEMPHYFRFLMIMAFHTFIEEQVDAVILEVGVGGTFDTTNFIRKPVVVGISSLGLEHQSVLGNTLEEIAMHKAGIMKASVPTYTVASHPPNILNLLRDHASKVGCPLNFVSENLGDQQGNGIPLLGVDDGDEGVSGINAALAIHLANEFLLQKHSHIFSRLSGNVTSAVNLKCSNDPASFLPFQTRGLQLTTWDGRFQTIEDEHHQGGKKITYYLDGAHTIDSIQIALDWFSKKSSGKRSLRLLIFNLSGDRDSTKLMNPLVKSDIFDLAIFCPFTAFSKKSIKAAASSADNWSMLGSEQGDPLEGSRKLARIWEDVQDRSKGVVLASAEETLEYIRDLAEGEQYRVNVLISGSLHLVGTFLTILQPNRNDE